MKQPFLLVLLFFSCSIFGQVTEPPGGLRHISVREGLPSSEVYAVLQDHLGYLWIATDAGVSRYDGFAFESFTTRDGLTDNTVFYLAEDAKGRIWALGFSGALCCFEDGKFHGIPANEELRTHFAEGKRFGYYLSIDAQGGVITGGLSTNGSYRVGPEDQFTKAHRVSPPPGNVCFKVAYAANGIAHCFSYDNYVGPLQARLSFNGHEQYFRLSEGATNSRTLLTHDHRLLLSNGTELLSMNADGKTDTLHFPTPIVGLNEDASGNLWISTYYGGTWMCANGNLRGERRHFLAGKTVSGVLEDHENGYWLSTVGDGLYYLPNLGFGYLTRGNGLADKDITGLAAYGKDAVILGLPNNRVGLFNPAKNEAERLRTTVLPDGPIVATEAVLALGDTILANGHGIFLYDSTLRSIGSFQGIGHAKDALIDPRTQRPFLYSHNGLYWFSSRNRFDSIQVTPVRFTAACFSHDGTLWLGAINGLWKYENGVPVYLGDSAQGGIPHRIDAICEDAQGVLWIATRGEGVFARTPGKTIHFTSKDGLASNTCRALAVDDRSNVWVGTNNGITMISRFDPVSGEAAFRTFHSADGLLADEVRLLLFHDGKLWMGSSEGLCWINAEELVREDDAPPVYITAVLFGKTQLPATDAVTIGYSDTSLRVFLQGISFHDAPGLRYRYRLHAGSEWITTANRELSFAGLSPGEYELEVYAVTVAGKMSDRPAVFHFTVSAPFWMTWWFASLIAVLLVGLVWLAAHFRLKHLRKRSEEKMMVERRMAELRLSALRAQMNPHFIFNAINSIQHYVLKNDSEQAYNYLAKFSRLIRIVLEQSQSDEIPLDQELLLLKLYIELEQLRFERPFRYTIDVDPELLEQSIRLPGMLVQPFVENAVWHGLLPKKPGDALVAIRFSKKDARTLHISVTDNGVGRHSDAIRKSESAHRSSGLKITSERLQLTGQEEIQLTDLKDEAGNPAGTRVDIFIRLRQDED